MYSQSVKNLMRCLQYDTCTRRRTCTSYMCVVLNMLKTTYIVRRAGYSEHVRHTGTAYMIIRSSSFKYQMQQLARQRAGVFSGEFKKGH